MNIFHSRIYMYIVSGILVTASLISLLINGLNLGTDFTGDAVSSIVFLESEPSAANIRSSLEGGGFSSINIDKDENVYHIRTPFLNGEDHERFLAEISGFGAFEEQSFISTGPTIGRQLRRNAIWALSVSVIAIVVFLAWSFRKVSRPLSSWIYGVIAIVALVHDVLIPTGLFSLLGIEINALFVTALLTILGFSVHDTIVVFDRVREHLKTEVGVKFEQIVERSVAETITRSINTSLTTLFALASIFFFGGETTRHLALALMIGIGVGTYSSLFLAAPLLVTVDRWRRG